MDIYGTVGNDTLNGTAGNDTITLNGGTDIVHAGDGDDQIVLNAPTGPALFGTGSVLDGGIGFDTFVLKPQVGLPRSLGAVVTPYVLTQASVTGIEGVRFDTAVTDAMYLAVLDQQISANGMTNLTGGAGRDILIDVVFAPGTYVMPSFTFTNWTSNILDPTSDYVSLFATGPSTAGFTLIAREGLASTQALSGSLGNDVLIGSSGSEFLTATRGVDQLYGNGGTDILIAENLAPYGGSPSTFNFAGDIFDGGDGIDVLEIGGPVNLTAATITNMERLYLEPAFVAPMPGTNSIPPSYLTITASQASSGFAADTLLLGAGIVEIQVGSGQSLDVSGWHLGTNSTVTVNITGTSGNETITGTGGDDTINGRGGVDVIHAGAGNDAIVLDTQLGFGSVLDGGDGFDTLVLGPPAGSPGLFGQNQVVYSPYFPTTLTSIEAITFLSGPNDFVGAIIVEQQRAASGLNTLIGGAGRDVLYDVVFTPDTYTMPNFTLVNWTSNIGDIHSDIVTLVVSPQSGGDYVLNARDGLASTQSLIGGSGNDILNGSSGSDFLDGRGGVNQLYGNGGNDALLIQNTRPFGGALTTYTYAGSLFDGGAGTDAIEVGGRVDFQGTLVSIERIFFDPAFTATAPGQSSFDPARLILTRDQTTGLATNLSLFGNGTLEVNLSAGQSFSASAYTVDAGYTVGLILNGSTGNETIIGSVTSDRITGGDGDDLIEGRGSNDTIDGGNGIDTASYVNASGAVIVDLGGGTASGADGNDTLVSIENITGSAFNDTLYGNSSANTIDGGAGDDGLYGFGGNDALLGGNGNDFLRGGNGDDTINGGAGFDRAGYYQTDAALGGATVDLRIVGPQNTGSLGWDTLIDIENVSGTPFADTLTGDAGDNWLWGSSSWIGAVQSATNNDVIDGGGGNDLIQVGFGNHILTGGSGSDTLLYSENGGPEVGVTVSLALQGGAQTTGAGSWTLSGFENLSGGTGNDQLTGDGNANVLAGGDGNDLLVGGGGNDSLYGDGIYSITGPGSGSIRLLTDANIANGAVGGNDTLEGGLGDDLINGGVGSDTASYANASGAVIVDLGGGTASGADGNDTLVSIENITGSAFNDTLSGNAVDSVLNGGAGHDFLSGNAGNDVLAGGTGDDVLFGGAGDDLLDGGTGFDRVAYSDAAAGVTVNLNLQGVAQNTGGGGIDTLSGIENVSGTQFNDTLIGDGFGNWLWGGTGNDNISAGAGDDLVEVGAGSHTLNGGTGIDTLSLWGHATDITAAGVTFSLALQGAAQNTLQGMMNATGFENVSGSRYNDTLTGDAGANILLGDTGNDTLNGGDGNDTLYGDGRISVDDHGTGFSGPITLFGDVMRDQNLGTGADGNDILNGGKGDDTLYGGRGNDIMSGGPGADRFIIEAQSGADRITDFAHVDRVVFDAFAGPHAFKDLILTAVGKDVMITWGTGDSLVIEGYRPRDLTAADFTFTPAAAPLAATSFAAVDSLTASAGYVSSDFANNHFATHLAGHMLIFG